MVLAEVSAVELERLQKTNDPLMTEGFRCDMSRVGFVRRRWELAVKEHLEETGLDVLESLRRIEAELRNPINAPELHIERR